MKNHQTQHKTVRMVHLQAVSQSPPPVIQVMAYCIIRRNHEMLLRRQAMQTPGDILFYPVGGALQVGEYSWDAVRRQVPSALGSSAKNLTFMGPNEFIGQQEGRLFHQIIFLFEAELANSDLYHRPQIKGQGPDQQPCLYTWHSPADFRRHRHWHLPESLIDLLLN
jgi:hypothetical protein